jgi:hypothetical protein
VHSTHGWPAIREGYARLFAGTAIVRVAFHDFTVQSGDDWTLFVGREKGNCTIPNTTLTLRIRTTRWFARRGGEWRQVCHAARSRSCEARRLSACDLRNAQPVGVTLARRGRTLVARRGRRGLGPVLPGGGTPARPPGALLRLLNTPLFTLQPRG